MASENNSTKIPLNASQQWFGKSDYVVDYTSICVSCTTDRNCRIALMFSTDNINFDFLNIYDISANVPFFKNQEVQAVYYKASILNNSGGNQTFLRFASVYKDDLRDNLDIRSLNDNKDTISIPALNDCIIDGKLNVNVEGVTVSGVVVDISGQTVNITGQSVKSQLYDSNGYPIATQLVGGNRSVATYNYASIRGKEGTDIKEINAVTDLAHGGTNLCVYDDVLNDKINNVNIAGEDAGAIKVFVSNTSAQKLNCNVNTISGFALESGGNLASIKTNTDRLKADSTYTDAIQVAVKNTSLDVSGTVTVNTISGFALETGGNLASIKTNTDRLKADTTYTDAIQVAVKNASLTVNTITGFATEVTADGILTQLEKNTYDSSGNLKIAGSVAVNTITGFATETTADGILTQLEKNTYDSSGNLKIAGSVSVNTISGFATEVTADGILTQLEKNTYDSSGNLKIAGSVAVNTITGFATEITADGILTQLEKNTYDSSGNLKIAGTVAVNTITGFATETTADGILTQLEKNTYDSSGNLKIAGTVAVNTISGFALETGGNLASIKTNTDRLKADTTYTDAIQVAVKNASLNVSGTVTVGNTSLNTHCYASPNGTTWHHLSSDANGQLNVHSKTQDGDGNDITSTTISTKRALDVNVAGGSLSLSSVNIKDSVGNNLQAVSNVLPQLKTTLYTDTGNAFGTSADPIKAQIVNTSAVPVSMSGLTSGVAISDGVNNANIKLLSTSDTITSTYGVTSKSLVCGVVSGTASPVGMTVGSALKVNVENTSVPVSGSVSISGTPSVNATIVGTPSVNATIVGTPTVSTTLSGATSSIQIGNGTNNATITGTISNIKTSNALVCDSALYGLNSSTGDVQPLTVNLNGSRNQLETRDNDAITTLSAINTKIVQGVNTTNEGGVVGLNTYSIYPRVRYYNMAGISQVSDNNMLMGGFSSSRYFFNDFFGLANVKQWWAYSETNNRNLTYEYITSTGTIQVATTNLVANTWKRLPLSDGSAGTFLINKWATDVAFVGNVKLYISYDSATTQKCMFGGDYVHTFSALFTVPAGYKAFITNINVDSNASLDYLTMFKWDATGVRSTVFMWSSITRFTGNFNNEFGGAGGCFEAGETIGFSALNNSSYKQFYATVMCRPV